MDHSTTEQELASVVASHDPIAAFLFQQKGDNAIKTEAMEVYVNSKVPATNFKDLLLQPRGGHGQSPQTPRRVHGILRQAGGCSGDGR